MACNDKINRAALSFFIAPLLIYPTISLDALAGNDAEQIKPPIASKIEEEYIRRGYVFFPPRQIVERDAAQHLAKENRDISTKSVEAAVDKKPTEAEEKKQEKSLIIIFE